MTATSLGAAVIIPTLNEEAHIGALLEQLLEQDEHLVGEILVADGGSADGTRAIVEKMARRSARVQLIDNPERIQSAGINRAASAAHPGRDLIIRMDAHAGYGSDFVERLTSTLRSRDAETVVVRLRTVGASCMERAIAAASNSVFGTGGAVHRVGGTSGHVDHGHHAGFRRAAFEGVGGYDPGFVANEDAEFDFRLRRCGGRIWFAADIEVDYYPRSTLAALARQYWRYGSGRAQNYRKHRQGLRLRQLVAPALVSLLLPASALALFDPRLWLGPLAYAAGCVLAALFLALREQSACVLLAAPALVAMHLGWGLGFLATIISPAARRRPYAPARPFTQDKGVS